MIMADMLATITLRSKLVSIREPRRLGKSFDYLKQAVARLSKVPIADVMIDRKLNEYMMHNASRRMARVEVKISKDGSKTKVMLAKPLEEKKYVAPVKETKPKQESKQTTAAPKEEKPKAQKAAPKAPKAPKAKEQE